MIDSGYEYNDDMLEDPAIPHVDEFDMIHIKVAMKSSHVRSALAEVCLRLVYEPNKAGLYSFRKYSIATVVREVGIDKGTRQAQHSKVTSTTVNSTYDADNASFEVGAAEMGRPAEYIEPVDSLARRRVPAIANIRGLRDCEGTVAYEEYFRGDAKALLGLLN